MIVNLWLSIIRKANTGSTFLFSQTCLGWYDKAVSRFYHVRLICSACFIPHPINSKCSDIAQKKTTTILIRKCHDHGIFGMTKKNSVEKCLSAVFLVVGPYLVLFAEVVADNMCWYIATLVNLGFKYSYRFFVIQPPIFMILT